MKTNKLEILKRKIFQTLNAIEIFIKQTKRSYKMMKNKIQKILAITIGLCFCSIAISSCNVTRKVTTESTYYQKGDTACTIIVKTIESYDASKKGIMQ